MAMLQSICRCRIGCRRFTSTESAKRTMSSTLRLARFSGTESASADQGSSRSVSLFFRTQTTFVWWETMWT